MVTCASDVVVPDGAYCTIIVHVPVGATTVPFAQVPPVIEKAPGPRTLVTMGAAVSVNEPAFAPVAVLVTVIVPVFVVVVAGVVVNDGVGAEMLTVATLGPPADRNSTAPASTEPFFLGLLKKSVFGASW